MKRFLTLCLSTTLVVAAGCGGGEEGSGAVLDDGQTSDSSALQGRLMMTNVERKARVIDLATGNVSLVPGVQEFGDLSGREYASMWKAYAHAQPYSGDRFVLTVESCKFNENDSSRFYTLDHCLALHKADGTEIAVKKFYGSRHEIFGSAKLSFDGNYIAAVINNNWVYIYDSQFNVVSRTKAPRTVISGVV
ncbi:MAG: hypothetical protein AB8C46_16805 [Burkholderiaceae bacterium]